MCRAAAGPRLALALGRTRQITALLARTMAQLLDDTALPAPGADPVGGIWPATCSALELARIERFRPARGRTRGRAGARNCGSEPEPPVVLHGDLHHENVIVEDRRDGSSCFDPKGVIGHPGYDVAPLLGNPVGRLAERVDVVALLSSRHRRPGRAIASRPVVGGGVGMGRGDARRGLVSRIRPHPVRPSDRLPRDQNGHPLAVETGHRSESADDVAPGHHRRSQSVPR